MSDQRNDVGSDYTRVHYREIEDRFFHVDAQLVRSSFDLRANRAEIAVEFYPWWEHPEFGRLKEKGPGWKIEDCESGARELRVHAIDPLEVKLSKRDEVIEWEFLVDHPLLWPYQDEFDFYCNSDVDLEEATQRLLAREISGVRKANLFPLLSSKAGEKAPFSIPRVPAALAVHLREVLMTMGVSLFLPREPRFEPKLVLFIMDDDDFIVARDFEVDLPEFEHREEWFRLTSPQ